VCCRPPGWGSLLFSKEQLDDLIRETIKTIQPENDNVEAVLRDMAIDKAARMWAKEPLCRSTRTESEVYRFTWHSSFDGDAVVRIGRQDGEIGFIVGSGRRARTFRPRSCR
jgi:hypothetical protein